MGGPPATLLKGSGRWICALSAWRGWGKCRPLSTSWFPRCPVERTPWLWPAPQLRFHRESPPYTFSASCCAGGASADLAKLQALTLFPTPSVGAVSIHPSPERTWPDQEASPITGPLAGEEGSGLSQGRGCHLAPLSQSSRPDPGFWALSWEMRSWATASPFC